MLVTQEAARPRYQSPAAAGFFHAALSLEPQAHGADPAGIEHETMAPKSLLSGGRCRH
jgi:hypothetical protein